MCTVEAMGNCDMARTLLTHRHSGSLGHLVKLRQSMQRLAILNYMSRKQASQPNVNYCSTGGSVYSPVVMENLLSVPLDVALRRPSCPSKFNSSDKVDMVPVANYNNNRSRSIGDICAGKRPPGSLAAYAKVGNRLCVQGANTPTSGSSNDVSTGESEGESSGEVSGKVAKKNNRWRRRLNRLIFGKSEFDSFWDRFKSKKNNCTDQIDGLDTPRKVRVEYGLGGKGKRQRSSLFERSRSSSSEVDDSQVAAPEHQIALQQFVLREGTFSGEVDLRTLPDGDILFVVKNYQVDIMVEKRCRQPAKDHPAAPYAQIKMPIFVEPSTLRLDFNKETCRLSVFAHTKGSMQIGMSMSTEEVNKIQTRYRKGAKKAKSRSLGRQSAVNGVANRPTSVGSDGSSESDSTPSSAVVSGNTSSTDPPSQRKMPDLTIEDLARNRSYTK